jgi:small basic protein (TIGR04137 family)
MSMDRSLKSKASLARHRNVLTRTERIKALQDQERFKPGQDRPTGLPKVAHRKAAVAGKVKKSKEEAAAGAEAGAVAGAPAAAPAAGAAKAPAAKDAKKDVKKDAGKK